MAAVLAAAAAVARRWPSLVAWAVAAALAAYAAGLAAAGAGLDPAAPFVAALLLLAAELAHWSIDEASLPLRGAVLRRRTAFLAGTAVATAGLGSLVLAAALVRPPGGPGLLALGVAGAVGAFALLARFAHARR